MSRGEESPRPSPGAVEPPANVAWLRRGFVFYLHRFFAKGFTAVRTSREGRLPDDPDRPLVVYSNHPSWWDPIHFAMLAHYELRGRPIYGPMDAEALEQYKMFKKLGVFGVERSAAGAARFLRTSLAILEQPGASLWLTAEGTFTDPRKRPIELMGGVGHLARRLQRGWVVPLALEYPFWNERLPECLSRFGEPIDVAAHDLDSDGWTALLRDRLENTLDELAAQAHTRDPQHFRTLLAGRTGIGGFYDLWRWMGAAFRGQRFDAAHGARPEREAQP